MSGTGDDLPTPTPPGPAAAPPPETAAMAPPALPPSSGTLPPPPVPAYTYTGEAQMRRQWDPISIIAFVFSLFGGIVVSLVLGIVGLVRTQDGQRQGRGFAIAAIAISVAWILVVGIGIFALIVFAPSSSTTSSVPPIGGNESVNDLEVGDCLANPQEDFVTSVDVVSCRKPHRGEVYARYSLPDTIDSTQVSAKAEAGCEARVPAALKEQETEQPLSVFMFYPPPDQWAAGDRRVTCLAVSANGQQLTKPLPTKDLSGA